MNRAPTAKRAPCSFAAPSGRGAGLDFDLALAADFGATAFHGAVLRVGARIALPTVKRFLASTAATAAQALEKFATILQSLPLARKLTIAVCCASPVLDF